MSTKNRSDKSSSSSITKDKYTIILPTYKERENLPIIIWLISTELEKWYVYSIDNNIISYIFMYY